MARYGLVDKNGRTGVPLQKIQVRGTLIGFTAEVTATMEYINNSDNPIETIYVFPLDEEAAVCGFQATIDGRTIVAEVQEKQEARDTYDDAISSGHSAYLLEESDESSDIFQINVGNLPPHKSATLQITFVTGLAVEQEGRVVFVLPTVLNPRYSPSESQPSLTTTMTTIASVSTKYSFDFELHVQCASAIKEITSPCNRLKVDINPDDKRQAKVRLVEEYQFNADVQVHVLGCKPFEAHALLEDCVTPRGEETNDVMSKPVVMLNFFPEFHSSAALERGEFIFVVDRSGSMSGSRIKSARETLLLFLKSLPDDCYFNVVGFGSSFKKLFKKSEAYNDSTVDKACSYAQSMEADLGGTEIFTPLEEVFSRPLIKGYPRQVILLTDGEVGNTQQVIDLTRRNADKARCFALGIGSGASTALIKGVARAGKGKAEFVTSSDQMKAKVIKMLKNALQPALLDCKLTWDLPKGCNAESVPDPLPAVFSGESLVVYGVLALAKNKNIKPLNGTVTLAATLSSSEQVTHKASFEGVSSESGGKKLLHRLAAKALIQAKQNQDDLNRTDEKKAEIIRLSKSANVISKLTSFVAVDKESHEPVSHAMTKPSSELLHLIDQGMCLKSAAVPFAAYACKSVPKKKSMSFLPSFNFKGRMKRKKCAAMAAAPCPPPQPRSSAMFCDQYDPTIEDDLDEECDEIGEFAECNYSPAFKSSPPPKPPKGNDLLDLVSLQKASGSWQLTEQLAIVCGVTIDKLRQTCPSQLTSSNKESVWATALALACLLGKFKDKKDEWDMVAAKGIKWLKKTIDDKVLSYEKIMEMAKDALGN